MSHAEGTDRVVALPTRPEAPEPHGPATAPQTQVRQRGAAWHDELRTRVARAMEQMHAVLPPAAQGSGVPLDEVRAAQRAAESAGRALVEALRSGACTSAAAEELWSGLLEVQQLQRELVEYRVVRRLEALERVREALEGLRELGSPGTVLDRAPGALGNGSLLDRVVVGRVNEGVLTAEAAWFRDDAEGAAAALARLRGVPVRLEYPLVETEIVRRRRGTIVLDAQAHLRVHRPTAEIMGWEAYVAAPVFVEGRLAGLLHADRRCGGPPVDQLDRDVLWAFADGFAQVFERAVLRHRLRRQHQDLQRMAQWIDLRARELSDGAIEISREEVEPDDTARTAGPAVTGDGANAIEATLTRREMDVLRLLSQGQTNARIASELVVSEGTVKFHVKNVLRKLEVANRAEAVSRYLTSAPGRRRA